MTKKIVQQTIRGKLEVIYKDIESAPVLAPNSSRAANVSDVIYLDLGLVDPFDAFEVGARSVPSGKIGKVNAHAIARLVLSAELAKQIATQLFAQLGIEVEDSPEDSQTEPAPRSTPEI